MKRNSPKNQQLSLFRWLPILSISITALGTFIASLIGWSVWVTKNVPQTDYVDALFKKNIEYVDVHELRMTKYIDEKIASLRKESFDHSDFNKSNMESEYKGLSAKIDMILLLINNNKAQKQ